MLTLDIKDKVVFITGSNRGIGRSFVEQALAAGASKVYATARNVDSSKTLRLAMPSASYCCL